MKIPLVFLFSLFVTFTHSQREVKEFYLNRNLKQDGLQMQFKILDEDKHGVWFYNKEKFYFWYKAQHVLSTQGESSGLLLHGEFESFYSNKQLYNKGEFHKGLKSGEWIYWREDGTIRRTEDWRNGNLKKVASHDSSGVVVESATFKLNKKIRTCQDTVELIKGNKVKRSVYQDNKLVKVETFKNDVLHGKQKFFENGKLVSTRKFVEGEEKIKIEKKDSEETIETSKKEKSNDHPEKQSFFKKRFKKKESTEEENE